MIARAETVEVSLQTALIVIGVFAVTVALSVIAGFVLARRAKSR
jgi:hypothetical protein